MLVILDSPVEARKYEIKIEKQTGVPYCKVIFCNLSKKNVVSLEYILICYDSFGEPVETPPLNQIKSYVQDINIDPKNFFSDKYPIAIKNFPTTRAVEIVVNRVMFSNGEVWSKGKYEPIDIKTDKLTGNDLSHLKEVAGEDAICYAREEENYWQCVCGKVNSPDNEICTRCERTKEKSFAYSNQRDVDTAFLIKKEQEETEMKIRMEQEQKAIDKNAKASLIMGLTAIVFSFILNFTTIIFSIFILYLISIIVLLVLGLILGIKGLKSLRHKRLAIAGISICSIQILYFIINFQEQIYGNFIYN